MVCAVLLSDKTDREKVILGGGHRGACRFHVSRADEYIPEIISILAKKESDAP